MQDRPERPGRKVTVAVHGYHDQLATLRSPQVVMATAYMGLGVARTPESPEKIPAADPRKAGQGAATSISTMSSWCCSSGTGRSFFVAASR